jgi:hypothetical protein
MIVDLSIERTQSGLCTVGNGKGKAAASLPHSKQKAAKMAAVRNKKARRGGPNFLLSTSKFIIA